MSFLHVPLETLVAQARSLECSLSEDELASVADLVLRLNQDTARQSGATLPAAMQRSYLERSESERNGMASAVAHVVVALVLLGYIEMPA